MCKKRVDTVASTPIHTPSLTSTNNKHEFKEILNTRSNPNFAGAGGTFHIRVTDSLTFYKIDSSTNELPLSDIDFSLNPLTPESPCNEHKSNSPCETRQKRHVRLLTMRAIASIDESDAANELYLPKISPLATNERPLSCNCLSGGGAFDENLPHSHSKSMADISPLNDGEVLHFVLGSSPISTSRVASIDDFQLSCSAPATILSSEFRFRLQEERHTVVDQLRVNSPTNSPTASTLKLCQESDERQLQQQAKSQQKYANELCSGVGADVERAPDIKTVSMSSLPTVQSAPVMINVENPFKFTQQAQQPFVNKFSTINEFDNTHATNTALSSPVQSSSACDFDTLFQHKHTDKRATNYHHNSRIRRQNQHQHKLFNRQQQHAPQTHTARIPDVIVTLSSSSTNLSKLMPDTNQFNSKLTPTVPTTYDPTNTTTTTTITTTNTTSTTNVNANMSASASITTSKSTPMTSSVIATCTSTATSAADGNATPVSSSSSVSSRRQRHSIAGQMSYMKMLGFGGFSKKMATSSSSLFSTAVISGSSSAPNLRDMIPCAVSSSGKRSISNL